MKTYNTPSEILKDNRELVYKNLQVEFSFQNYNMVELATDFLNYVSKGFKPMTFDSKKIVKAYLEMKVSSFKMQYKALSTNHGAVAEFDNQRKQAAFNSKSF